MKLELQQLVQHAIQALQKDNKLPNDLEIQVQIERARDKQHGDFASNIAMILAKAAGFKPRELAELLVAQIPSVPWISAVSIAGPGFINFSLSSEALHQIIPKILEQGKQYGKTDLGKGKRINVEFVSANPTGPLHVGHGRGSALGASLSDLLSTAGFDVHREYYVNDAGRQMDILAVSVWLRYLELLQLEMPFPSNAYKGQYVIAIAEQLKKDYGDTFTANSDDIYKSVPADATEHGEGDKEAHIDGLIVNAKQLLGKNYTLIFNAALQSILADIAEDLKDFGVEFEEWFSENSLKQSGAIQHAIDTLRQNGHLYERDGATWFSSIPLGDDKDRVLIRENGQTTYFASDVAYLLNKFERGYDQIFYVMGADHHGYINRLKAAAKALHLNADNLHILLIQFAVLYRGQEKIQMSTRSGSFVTLRELREEVGKDAARYFYIMRKSEQHMDFDLELAKSHSIDNPVYYIQYAHARICSVFRQLQEKQMVWDKTASMIALDTLQESHEKDLLAVLSRYPEVIVDAATHYEPHLVANYLRELATDLHTYYNAHQFLVGDPSLRNARLSLIAATKQVLENGLTLLGLSSPEKM